MLAAGSTSVVVPLYNGRDLIADCLRSIPDGVQVVVVDDGSTDGAPELVAADFPSVGLMRNTSNMGFGATANRGLAACSGAVRVVLNSDARLLPGSLERLAQAFADPAVGIAGPRLVFPDGSHQTSAASFPRVSTTLTGSFLLGEIHERLRPGRHFRFELGMTRAGHAADRDVDWVMGTCLAIGERCLAQTGGFDEGYYLYAEETDLCWRARQAGWRVRYVAGSVVEHLGGGSTGDPEVHAPRSLRGEARFMARAYGRSVLPRWRAARIGGSALKVALLAAPALVDGRCRNRLRWHLAALAYLRGGGRTELSELDGVAGPDRHG